MSWHMRHAYLGWQLMFFMMLVQALQGGERRQIILRVVFATRATIVYSHNDLFIVDIVFRSCSCNLLMQWTQHAAI